MTVNGTVNGTANHPGGNMSSIIIVGAGNFGAATALSLAKQGGVKVTLVDTAYFPNPRAASHDVNKIVRDDYPDTLYMRMLYKAMPIWRTDHLYSPWYHEVGMLRADPSEFGEKSIAAYKNMGIANNSEFLPVEEVRKRWNGAFQTSNFDGIDKVLYNPNVGFAEADKALGAVVQLAVNHGVEYLIGEMTRLAFTSNGKCSGIELKDGRTLQADKVLMATGARTAPLLAQSAPKNKDLHVGNRLQATGAVSFHAKVHGAQQQKLSPIPVLKNCLPQVKGTLPNIEELQSKLTYLGEGMSILKDGTIKFNCDLCFTNYVKCPATGERMSMAPDNSKFNVWTSPNFVDFFEKRARKTMDGLYGEETKDVSIDAYRMCWYVILPMISPSAVFHEYMLTITTLQGCIYTDA